MSPEERIGAAVAEWLRAAGWQVYAEVVGPWGKQRPDIVAVKDEIVWIVECKVRLSFRLIQQAWDWETWAHRISVATSVVTMGTNAAVLRTLDLGWLHVGADGVTEVLPLGWRSERPRRVGILLDALRPEHAESRPGNADSAYHTATQERDARLRAHVAAHPGVELRQACDALGIRLDADGRRTRRAGP